MELKKNDVEFNPEELNGFNPKFKEDGIKLYFHYVLERFEIQRRRESGQPFPWTEEAILRDNSFTNNRRQDDRTTKWTLNNIAYNNKLSNEEKFWRTLLFRIYNKIDTGELLELNNPDNNLWEDKEKYRKKFEEYPNDPYTRAYRIIKQKYIGREKKGDPWKHLGYFYICDVREAYNGEIPDAFKGNSTMKDGFEWMLWNIKGAGRFTGMQYNIDMCFLDFVPFSNNCYVIAGPGAQTGLHRIVEDWDGMSYEQMLWYITINFEKLCREWYDPNFDMNTIREYYNDPYAYCAQDIQNTFCEYGKYRYIMDGTHKKRRKYIYRGDNV